MITSAASDTPVSGQPVSGQPASVEPVADDVGDRLVKAAAKVFAEKGYDGAGVQQIARAAGLTTGAIYSRYEGKAELLKAAIASECRDELDELFQTNLESPDPVSDIITTIGSHLVEPELRPGDGLLFEAFAASRRHPELRQIVADHVDERRDRFSQLVELAKLEGSVDAGLETETIVHFCHGVGLGMLMYDAISAPHPKAEPWEELLGRLIAAAGPNGPAEPTSTSQTNLKI